MRITKLTDNGRVRVAAISPDGHYVAYAMREAQRSSLWVRQVATESAVEVVPPSDGSYMSMNFSPDGDYLYFAHDREGARDFFDVFVVPALGGKPRLVIQDVDSGVGVSPDGKSLAFHRGFLKESRLLVANSDGTGEHVIAEPTKPNSEGFNSRAPPSWSSDGKLIEGIYD